MDTLLSEATDYEVKIISYMLENGYDAKEITHDSIYVYSNWDEAVEDFVELFLEVPSDSKILSSLHSLWLH